MLSNYTWHTWYAYSGRMYHIHRAHFNDLLFFLLAGLWLWHIYRYTWVHIIHAIAPAPHH